jgi:tetratricopeptide (TPR) repeat protein
MERLYREYPDDQEAACLYALSLLGTVRPGDPGFRRQMQAGAIALEVYQKNPQHPGAAHYIIHAFDDPEHAILALSAARRYADIAPAAHHARHMPSHIFLQLGMWPEASAANASAWDVSVAWVQRKHLPLSKRDYHSLHWLLYSELQRGRYQAAEEQLALMRQILADDRGEEKLRLGYTAFTYAAMVAAFVVETERWDLTSTLLVPLQTRDEPQTTAAGAKEHTESDTGQPTAATSTAPGSSADWTQLVPLHIRGLAAAAQGLPEAQQRLAELRALGQRQSGVPERTRGLFEGWEVRTLEIAAVAHAEKGDLSEALTLLQRATALEESLSPPSGPPSLIKPAHELYGEMLLRAGRPTEAAAQFATALLRQPNRARSLLGTARAAARSGDTRGAALAYAKLVRQWQQGDPQLAELHEAQAYLQQASAD